VVIERALEKLRKDKDGQSSRYTPQGETAMQRAGRHVGRRVGDQPIQRHTFPRLLLDRSVVASHRVLAFEAEGTEDAHADAAYRMLRTRLLHRMVGNNWTTLGITSPGAGEGKSLTALNLAINFARARAGDVFLLDVDLRSPSVCEYLGVDAPHDLAAYFAGSGNPHDVFFTIGVENLVIAGSSGPTEQASELLTSGRFEELLASIATLAADPIVLLDLPPLLVTDEALIIAPRVDAIALVVSEGRTRRDALERAKHLLEEFSFAGVILNRASESFGADSYYGYRDRYRDRSAGDSKA